MTHSTGEDVTALLRAWRGGEPRALDRLIPHVYGELRKIAARRMNAERKDHTLQATALVHEAFQRLIDADISWSDRAHFFAVAATTMRRILVEHARKTRSEKRGGGAHRVELHESSRVVPARSIEILALDEALRKLESFDERKARVIELYYFGGMTYEEAAESMSISPATFHRELRLGRAWLQRELGGAGSEPDPTGEGDGR